ncbi:ABC transporter ATP-binding protein [Aquimarina rhabdastrellae]
MNLLEVTTLSKSFDQGKTMALDQVSFTIKQGKVIAIVGESGSAKTTLIRLISGLETPDYGVIKLKGEVISSLETMVPPEKRNVGLVFQDYALFPHLTVAANVGYGIKDKTMKEARIAEVLNLVGLAGYEKRYPHQLSGGQQQRVALARAIAPQPELLILDEPFSNLDTMLREQLRNEIFEIIKKTAITAIFVTHDTEDALAVSDRIMVLKKGKLIQKDKAKALYKKPDTPYVASLFGTIIELKNNVLEEFGFTPETNKHYALRAQDIKIEKTTKYQLEVQLKRVQFMGEYYQIEVITSNGNQFMIHAPKKYKQETLTIGFNPKNLLVFETN